jgi:RNA polymerase sigma factor (sigma-70 family)
LAKNPEKMRESAWGPDFPLPISVPVAWDADQRRIGHEFSEVFFGDKPLRLKSPPAPVMLLGGGLRQQRLCDTTRCLLGIEFLTVPLFRGCAAMAIGTENSTGTSEPDRWTAEARSGSMAALDKLLVLVAERLREELDGRRVRGLSPSRSGSDLIQDTLLVIRKKFPYFKGETFGEFKRWARGILHWQRMTCMRSHRRRTSDAKKRRIWQAVALRRNLSNDDRSKQEGGDSIEQRDEWDRAFAALRRLKPHEQYILKLRYIDSLPFAAIASLVNSSDDTVSRSCRRALNRLRRRLER